jgi:DNA-binding NtrC family response regulator
MRPDLRAEGVAARRPAAGFLSSVLLFGPAAYAAAVVLRASPRGPLLRALSSAPRPAMVLVALVPVALLSFVAPRLDGLGEQARRPARVALSAGLAAAILVCGVAFAQTTPGVQIGAVFAAAIAAAAAIRSTAAIHGLGGVGRIVEPTIARDARRLGWLWIAAASSLAAHRARPDWPAEIGVLLALSAGLSTLAHEVSVARRRRLELGARERHELLLASATLTVPLALVATSGGGGTAEAWVVAPGIAFAAAATVAQAVDDPIAARAVVLRVWAFLLALLLGWKIADALGSPLAFVTVGIVAALVATSSGRRLSIGASAHAEAARLAQEAATARDRGELARGVLMALRAISTGGGAPVAEHAPTPKLLLFAPPRELSLEPAGVVREVEGAAFFPPALAPLLETEPLGVVRVDVLRALEVRRPDLREALAWCEAHEAAAVVAVVDDGELEGLLLLAAGPEAGDAVDLRTVRALRAIARVTAARLALEATTMRASLRAEHAEADARRIEVVLDRVQERERRLSRAVAAASLPLEAAIAHTGYAPAMRALLDGLDGKAKLGRPLVLLHRLGVDPRPFAARIHRVSRKQGALQIVDAARSDLVEILADPDRSPIELARDGTLLVTTATALPREAQRRLLQAIALQEGPGPDPRPLDLRLILSVVSSDPERDDLRRLLAALTPALAERLDLEPLRVPPLAARIEDLRAIVLDRLAVFGPALRDRPLGLADDALALLVEHEFPGDDHELDDLLLRAALLADRRAALRAEGARIERADVAAVLGGAMLRERDESRRR